MSSTRKIVQGLALAGLVVVCGCATAAKGPPSAERVVLTPLDQYPVQTVAAPEGILLAPHDYGLSARQADALKDLAHRWGERRQGLVLIESPVNGGGAAGATAYAARDALASFGVPFESIDLVGYEAGGPPGAPIRVSYLARQAKLDNCSNSWNDLTKSARNEPRANFGCAVNANIAAMIANPADIDRPSGIDPVDAGRRQTVLEKYRAGEVTSSAVDAKADGAVSKVVN